jgi:uncharacterized phiE125 gp8 family phage protein
MMIDGHGNIIPIIAALSGTAGSVEALISLAEVKTFLRVDGTSEDVTIRGHMAAARRRLEADTGRVLLSENRLITFDQLPADGVIRLPIAPVRSVTSITFYSDAMVGAVVDSAIYVTDLANEPARIVPAPTGSGWPEITAAVAGVRVLVAAGYENAGDVPEDLLEALKLQIARLYARAPEGAPFPAYEALIADWRLSWAA